MTPPPQTQELFLSAQLYAGVFASRQDIYSYWSDDHWKVAKDGQGQPKPLTADVIIKAFETKVPVSGYFPDPLNETAIAALDFDRDDGWTLGKRFCGSASKSGVLSYLERSRRGCHIWIPIDRALSSILVRRALLALLNEAGIKNCTGSGQRVVEDTDKGGKKFFRCRICPARAAKMERMSLHRDPRLEIRPATDRIDSTSFGHALRLPTMVHPTMDGPHAGERAPLISSEGMALPKKLVEMMRFVIPTPAEVLIAASERAPLPKLGSGPRDLRYAQGEPEDDGSTITDVLRDFWGVAMARAGRAIRCPAHDDHDPSLSIAKDDERAWCHQPACVLNNGGRGVGTHQLRQLAPRRA